MQKTIVLSRLDVSKPIIELRAGDRYTTPLKFCIPRSRESVDLGGYAWCINLKTADGTTDVIPIETTDVSDHWVTFEYVLPAVVTQTAGDTTIEINAVDEDGADVWKSGKRTIRVSSDLEVAPEYDPDSISVFQQTVYDVGVKVNALKTLTEENTVKINNAVEVADSASETANEASETAEKALEDVSQALTEAQAAKEECDAAAQEAKSKTDSAVSTAKTATDNANTAANTANTAADNANTAAKNANAAKDAANTATLNANTARDNAISAAGVANTAAQNADSAKDAANTAAKNADAATAMANAAASNCVEKATLADTAASNADEKAALANTAASTANTAAETANTAAEGIDSKIATKAEQTDVDALKDDLTQQGTDFSTALADVAIGDANVFRVYPSKLTLALGKITASGAVVLDGVTCHTSTKIVAYNVTYSTNYAISFDGTTYKVDVLGYTNESDSSSAYETGFVTTSPLSIYSQTKNYVNLNVRRVDGGSIDAEEMSNIVNSIRYYYAIGNMLAKRVYVTEAINNLRTALSSQLMPKVNTITVSASDNLRTILESLTDASDSNRYEVYISEGTYDIASYYTDEEWDTESSNFRGLFVPDYVTLIGDGDKENVILTASSDTQREYLSALNLSNTSGLKNLTVKATNLRYTIHDDFATAGQDYYERVIENCDFYGTTLKKIYVYGGGLKQGANMIIRNCTFNTDVSSNFSFLYHSNVDWNKSANVLIENCRFNPTDTSYGVVLSSMGTDTKFVYVTLKGNKMKRLRLNENSVSTYGAGIKFKVIGYANSITDAVQIMNSDGVDYSSYVNLI